MESTKISVNIQRVLNTVLDQYEPLKTIVKAISDIGGRSLLVGGAVRDLLLGLPVKDLDIEVHAVALEELEKLLKQLGRVDLVGKSFGVFRLHGLDVDWSLPRKDSEGRKPDVVIDPAMKIKDAFARRDLTINAIGIDLVTFELIDPYDGFNDLKKGTLRAPDKKKFIEDPLRFYRVMQFISRFEMTPDDQLHEICKTMDISDVSVERIETEFEKLMLKSKRPSLGVRWLQYIERLKEVLPELWGIVGVPQDEAWHPEGDVFEHTMQCLDAAAAMDYENDKQKLVVMFAVLCHDLGKAKTTEKIGGVWKSIGHSKEGEKLSKDLLRRITKKKNMLETIGKLVRYHMSPSQFVASGAKPSAYKRLARKIAPGGTLELLAKVALADKLGRNPIKGVPLKKEFPAITKFLDNAKKANVEKVPESPVLMGRDLMDVVAPGPQMGKLLRDAYEIQIEQGICDKKKLKQMVLDKR